MHYGSVLKHLLPKNIKTKTKNTILCIASLLKGVCHEIFDLQFFHDLVRAPDKQAKLFSDSVSKRYSITKFEKF